MTEVIQQMESALAVGAIYALIALGVGILYNILGLINFAHGDLMVLGAYAMALVGTGASFGLIVLAGVAAAMAAALVLERVAFRPVRGASPSTLLMTSFAISVILQSIFLTVFGGPPKGIGYPDWTRESLEVAGISIGYFEVATFVVTAAMLGALVFVLRKTVIGMAMRAAAEDFPATRLMGIKANAVVVAAFAVSGILAGVASVFWFSESSQVTATSGLSPVLKGFIACVIGGVGTLSGPVLGGFVLAFAEAFFRIVLPVDWVPYSDAFVYMVLIGVLFFRPQGLLSRPAIQKA